MADIKSFKGIRYNNEKIDRFENVITLPYDKIDPEMQDEYYSRSPYNYVRVILGKNEIEGETEKYKKARNYIDTWLKENVLIKDGEESLYPYIHEYTIDGVKKIRFSFITALKLTDYSEGIVIPHERTLSGPKKDRKRLLEETHANTELIFLLFQDKKNKVKKLFNKVMDNEPIVTMQDDDGTIHKVFKVDDKKTIEKVKKTLKDKKVFIADGHHRYETSLAHAKENPDNFEAQYILCSLVNMDDLEGLTILPTHRVVKKVENFNKDKLIENLKTDFDLEEKKSLEELNTDLTKSKKSFGLCFKNEFYLVKLRSNDIAIEKIDEDVSDAYKLLDVAILHKLILENHLGIDKKKLEEKTNLEYIRGYKKAYDTLVNNNFQCAFLLNPTKINELSEVASNGDKMPQKSTDFYPKLLSGFVLREI